jgi:muconolactone delta-isomerase
VARLNSGLTQILQSTYLGGSGDDDARALAIHPTTGEVYVAGITNSTNFPRTSGGAQAICISCRILDPDAFVARLNSSLTQILQSTYLGGSSGDYVRALAIHPKTGEVYVAGVTNSTDFPNTTGGAQGSFGGSDDAFVARLNSSLTQILQSTYLGESGDDDARALAIHPTTGDVYVAGGTDSNNFPRTSGGAQTGRGGNSDAFVARLTADLAAGSGSGSGGSGSGGGRGIRKK